MFQGRKNFTNCETRNIIELSKKTAIQNPHVVFLYHVTVRRKFPNNYIIRVTVLPIAE